MCIYNCLLLSFYIAVSDFHSKCIVDNNCIDTATFFLPCTLTSTYSSIDSTSTSGNKYQCQYYYNYMNYLYS